MRVLSYALLFVLLVGCMPASPEQELLERAQEAVILALRDPESARFEAVQVNRVGNVCGLVNARNGFGGYTGFRPFAWEATADQVTIVEMNAYERFDPYGTAALDRLGCNVGPQHAEQMFVYHELERLAAEGRASESAERTATQ